MNATTAAHAVALAAVLAGRSRVGQRLGALETIRVADLVGRLALGADHLRGQAAELQVGLEFPRREITVVGVLRQVDAEQLEERICSETRS